MNLQANNKNLFLKQFLLMLVPVCSLIIAFTYFALIVDKKNKLSVLKSEDQAAVNLKKKFIEGELGIAKSDLKTFVSNNDLFSYFSTGNSKYLDILEKEYLEYCKNKELFDQIAVIDTEGIELLKISYKKGIPYSETDSTLESRINKKYFKETFKLTEEEIYISQLDLKRNDGKIIQPFKPIIHFGLSLFGFDEKKMGVIIFDYKADRFLRSIDEPVFGYKSNLMLLSSDGYFLHSPDPENEWGFILEDRKDKTFSNKYGGVWSQISNELNGQVETKDGLFTFNTVYPTFGYRLDDMLSQTLTEIYSWKLVSFIPRESLNEAFAPIKNKWFLIGLFFILSALLFIGFIAGLRVKNILARQQIEYHLDSVTNLNSQLIKSEKHLLEENENKDRFISILSHDLKNPLGTLRNFSNLLNDEFDDLNNDERKNFVRSINDIAGNTVNLLLTLLDWSRINLGTMEFTPEYHNLSKIVDQNIKLFKHQAIGKNILLFSEVNDDIKIFADENMVNTLFRNFLSNAVKFTNKNGYVKVYAAEKEDFVEVCIEDNGIGMSLEQIDKILDGSKRHSTYGTENELGTGLGLKLCKELIEKQHGEVHFVSEEGKGSTVYFTLNRVDKKTK